MVVSLRQPVIVIGRVEPVVRAALTSAWSATMDLHLSNETGWRLVEEGRALGATAVVTRRDDVHPLCGHLPHDIIVLGVAAASFDLLICSGTTIEHLSNPDPQTIGLLIRQAARQTFL
jgi:hypothetical protein